MNDKKFIRSNLIKKIGRIIQISRLIYFIFKYITNTFLSKNMIENYFYLYFTKMEYYLFNINKKV
jgi:hypothetical protein